MTALQPTLQAPTSIPRTKYSKMLSNACTFSRRSRSKRRQLLLTSGLLLLSITAIPPYFPSIHAAGFPGGPGMVCLMDPSTAPPSPANPCPATPYTFTGPFPSSPQIAPTQIRIGIYINGSNSLNGFDITLKSNDTSVLVPANFDLTGTILPSASGNPTTIQGCVNGILVAGNTCAATDTYGTIHVYGVGGLGLITTAPTTGLLFTSIWNIVGNSPATGTGISFQTGCSNTSVNPNVCVTIVNGTLTRVPVTLQTRNTFSNPAPLSAPWIALTSIPNASSISVVRGSVFSIAVTAIAENGWPGLGSDLVTFSSQITSGFTSPAFSVTSCSTGGTRCGTTATLNTATAGAYVVIILANYTAIDPNTLLTDTLVASLRFNVNVQDATISLSSSGNVYMFGTFPITVTVQSIGGYSGTITLSTGIVSPATGITFSYPAPFTLAANGVAMTTVNVMSTTFNRYLYQMRLTASGTPAITHNSATLAILVTGFSLSLNASSVPPTGNSPSLVLSLKSLGVSPSLSFAGPISVSATSTPSGARVSFNTTSVTLTSGGFKHVQANFTSGALGVYTVNILATGGTGNLMTNQTVGLFFNLTDSLNGVRATVSGATSLYHTSGLFGLSTYLTAVNATSGATYSKIANLAVLFNSHGTGHFIVEISTSPYMLSMDCEINANTGTASCLLTRNLDIFHTGKVDLNAYSLVNLLFETPIDSPNYNPLADVLAARIISINDLSVELLYLECQVIP